MLFADALDLDSDDRRIGRDLESRHLSNLLRRLAHALGIDAEGRSDQQLLECFALFRSREIRFVGLQLLKNLRAEALLGHQALLARADSAIVECLTRDHL